MNVESLVGTTLGTCTLQQLIGQGGMGAVFLAQQSRPRRQVAVKVLLLGTRLTPSQRVAFLERFRRETDAAASLEHPNILPVHEYGERDGLAYLVMPYVSGGTLRDALERKGQLPYPQAVNYLDQLAAALDLAHERGVVHRDVKPANVLMTVDDRLLLTDFGLVKIVAEDQVPQSSITGAGVPLGTPDYMAPEQVVGGEVDGRADIYALGIVLYQMLTGRTPFTGDMPMQIVVQQMQALPPSPRILRPDLPITAEQVILRALAKKPVERYNRAQDFASAFRLALAVSGIQLAPQVVGGNGPLAPGSETRFFTPRGLFDPSWQASASSAYSQDHLQVQPEPLVPVAPTTAPKSVPGQLGRRRLLASSPSFVPVTARADETPAPPISHSASPLQSDIVAKTSMTLPSFNDFMPPSMMQSTQGVTEGARKSSADTSTTSSMRPRFGHKTGLLRSTEGTSTAQTDTPIAPPLPTVPATPTTPVPPVASQQSAKRTISLNPISPLPMTSNVSSQANAAPESIPGGTGVLPEFAVGSGATTTMKLTQSFKVVQVPVAGQPGQYLTGLLPVLSPESESQTSLASPANSSAQPSLPSWVSSMPYGATINRTYAGLQKYMKVVLLAAAILIVLLGSGTFLLVRSHIRQQSYMQKTVHSIGTSATANVKATATAEANIILVDPLSDNSHNWPVATTGSQIFVFKNNAYHILNNDQGKYSAIALLPEESLHASFVYTLTMQEIKGNDTSVNNQFGLIFRFSVHQKDGKSYKSFYIFEVSNTDGGDYELLKYDDSNTSGNGPWSTIWSGPFGKEFHKGHDPSSINTFKVVVDKSNFTLVVNNKQVGKAHDGALSGGQIGMLVNQEGTEVAFSNLSLAYK